MFNLNYKAMKRLSAFKDQLRQLGFSVQTNWQTKNSLGHVIEHCRISNNKKWIMTIFQIHGKDEGFSLFLESRSIKMSDSVLEIHNAIDRTA